MEKLATNMKKFSENTESCEVSCNKHQVEHNRLSELLSSVYATHRNETLEFQRQFTTANSAWLEETTSGVSSLGTAAQNAFITHLDAASATRDEMNALRRDIDEFKVKMDERNRHANEKYAAIMDALGKLVTFETESKSEVNARLADWALKHSEMSRRSELASERANEEAQWIRRQFEELDNGLRETNETVMRAAHNHIVDVNIKYVEQAELASREIGQNYSITNDYFIKSLKHFYKVIKIV